MYHAPSNVLRTYEMQEETTQRAFRSREVVGILTPDIGIQNRDRLALSFMAH